MALSFFARKTAGDPIPTAAPTIRVDERSGLSGDSSAGPPTELSGLDFTRTDVGRGLARVAGMVEVMDHGEGIGATFEEAAVLYANGNDAEAAQVLTAVLDDPSAQCGEGLWMMLLDLLRLCGARRAFEVRAAAYAARFGRAQPVWSDLSAAVRAPPRVNLAGKLGARAQGQLARIAEIARGRGAVVISLAKVSEVDGLGSSLLYQLLQQLAAQGSEVQLSDFDAFARALARRLSPGWAEEADSWLLMLELLRHAGERVRFEELARDYASTFGPPAPQWSEPGPGGGSATASVVAPAAASARFVLAGELTGAANPTLRLLAERAADQDHLHVDCAGLRRMDFVCAGALFNLLATLRAQGKQVTLYKVNAMVAALLRIMSVDQVALVTLRR